MHRNYIIILLFAIIAFSAAHADPPDRIKAKLEAQALLLDIPAQAAFTRKIQTIVDSEDSLTIVIETHVSDAKAGEEPSVDVLLQWDDGTTVYTYRKNRKGPKKASEGWTETTKP